jgi:hypothetical protein
VRAAVEPRQSGRSRCPRIPSFSRKALRSGLHDPDRVVVGWTVTRRRR